MQELTLNNIDQLVPVDSGESWKEYRFIAKTNLCDIPVLVRLNNPGSDRLLVTYNGAIQRAKAPDGVVFQRSSWLDEFAANVVQIADPTMYRHASLQIGWGQLDEANWAIESYVEILDALRQHFGLGNPEKTLHYGSSAGGFQASATAVFDRGSRVLVNNPQFDWSRYLPAFINALLRNVFPNAQLEEIKAASPWRVSVLDLFARQDYVPEMDVMVNLASHSDLRDQLLPAVERLSEIQAVGTKPKVTFSTYHDEKLNHNPLNKNVTISRINAALESLY